MPFNSLAQEPQESTQQSQKCSKCSKDTSLDELKVKLKNEMGIETKYLSNDGVAKIENKALSKNNDFKKLLKKLKKEGYKEVNLDGKSLLFENATIDKGLTKSDLSFVYGGLKDKAGNVVIYTLGYSSATDEFFQFTVEKIPPKAEAKDDIDVLIQNNNNDFMVYGKDYNNTEGDVSTQGFTWNGKAFACGMAGVVACIQFCLVYTLLNPIAGTVCDVACAVAMTAVCSVNGD